MLPLAPALALLLSLSAPPPPAEAIPDTAAVVPVSQVLELELDPTRETWMGSLYARLAVRRETRRIAFTLRGPQPSRIELDTPAGRVPLVFGWSGQDTLLIETLEPLAPGDAALNLSLVGPFASSGHGLRRPDAKHVVLEHAAGLVVPRWPAGTPETVWRLSVHAPARYDVIANLPRATRSLQRDWGTWEFVSGAPVSADSLRAEVRPLVPRPVRRTGGAVRRRPRRR